MLNDLADGLTIGSIILIGAELIAILTVINVVMSPRSATSVWGWAMSVLAFPLVAVPIYWILGREKFHGYIERRKEVLQREEDLLDTLTSTLEPYYAKLESWESDYAEVLDDLSERRFTRGNDVRLLNDGEAVFDEIFRVIAGAREYLLVQFYIIRNDELGRRFREALEERAREGIRVFLLYDEIGSYHLPQEFVIGLREAGVDVRAFHSTQGRSNRFQINFRNHRKVVIADGLVATCGGHNVGNEYLGRCEKLGVWRDTSVRLAGPAVMSLQMIFLEDWYWACREIPPLNWTQPDAPVPADEDRGMTAMTLPFGPVENVEGGTLFFLNTIVTAKRRLWIASPYFVPDSSIVAALQLAALRGVDVRVIIPGIPDKKLPWLASFSFLKKMEAAGVKMMRFTPGFSHQKIILVDDRLASVGTANLDNRSMRLNFEVNVIVLDEGFCGEVEKVFLEDFENCRPAPSSDFFERPWYFRLAVNVARLAAPVL